ncbi:MAG: DUF2931 family protein [Ectothiorhodospiraceae bacterium]|nr:DUF2931 family protein [Ectothiorhodospiraceae bacterium]MCH8503261.1 DUF2931 family protein [Ectothiorhodospiraceae bacterium]
MNSARISSVHHLLWLALLAALAGCASNPGPPYPYAVITGGGPDGWPAWVEELRFDGYVNIGGGSIGGRMTWDSPPDDGAITVMDYGSIPRTVYARWFSHRTLTFYEIHLELPEDTEQRMRKFYREHPASDYRHALMVHISGDGRLRIWWRAMCRGFCRDDPAYLPIVKEAVGEQIEGDPSRYANRTAQQRERGRIPPEPEPPPR